MTGLAAFESGGAKARHVGRRRLSPDAILLRRGRALSQAESEKYLGYALTSMDVAVGQ
jgi:hypothetical protein